MKLLITSVGLILYGSSVVAMAGNSSVSIGGIDDGVQIVTSGQGGTNNVHISGKSINLGTVSSIVGTDGTRSEIQLWGIKKQNARLPGCDDSSAKISVSGVGRSADVDGRKMESLCISGSNNQVTARHAKALTLISLSGTRNVVKVKEKVKKLTLRLGGVGNTVYLSRQANVQLIRSGIGNKVIRF